MISVPDKGYVYSLLNPNTGVVFYIGSSIEPRVRLLTHIWMSKNPSNRAKVYEYIRECKIIPTLNILEEIKKPTKIRLLEAKYKWIQKYPSFLTNSMIFYNVKVNSSCRCRKEKISVTLDENVLEDVAIVMSAEDRPSLSNTIEFLIKKGYSAWLDETFAEPIKKKKNDHFQAVQFFHFSYYCSSYSRVAAFF